MVRTVMIVYASTSGHTEHVVGVASETLEGAGLRVVRQKAELTKPEDLLKGDVLLLASGTWNTGNVEGQLNPYMYDLLLQRAQAADFKKKPCAAIGLGDERYHYTARAAEHLATFIKDHGGTLLLPALKIVNEPYGQEEKIRKWSSQFLHEISKLPPPINK